MPDKLKSRKFWIAMIGQIVGIAVLCFPEHATTIESAATNAAALLLMALTGMGYIKGEAMVDQSMANIEETKIKLDTQNRVSQAYENGINAGQESKQEEIDKLSNQSGYLEKGFNATLDAMEAQTKVKIEEAFERGIKAGQESKQAEVERANKTLAVVEDDLAKARDEIKASFDAGFRRGVQEVPPSNAEADDPAYGQVFDDDPGDEAPSRDEIAGNTAAMRGRTDDDLHQPFPSDPVTKSSNAGAIMIIIVSLFLGGCVSGVPVEPTVTYTRTVGKKWVEYVDNDATLTDVEKSTYKTFHTEFSNLVEDVASGGRKPKLE